jgi:hypothetical protein
MPHEHARNPQAAGGERKPTSGAYDVADLVLRVIVDRETGLPPERKVRAGLIHRNELADLLGIHTNEAAAILADLGRGIPYQDTVGEEQLYLLAAAAVGGVGAPAAPDIEKHSDNHNGYELVRRGYAETTRCLQFAVEFHLAYADGLEAALLSIREILGSDVADSVERLADQLAENHPGTRPLCAITVGREFSQVIYLHCSPQASAEAIAAVNAIGADEVSSEQVGAWIRIRAWWD